MAGDHVRPGVDGVIRFFPWLLAEETGEAELRSADPELDFFVNANIPGKLGRAVLKALSRRVGGNGVS